MIKMQRGLKIFEAFHCINIHLTLIKKFQINLTHNYISFYNYQYNSKDQIKPNVLKIMVAFYNHLTNLS